jgi:hypothetical protein
MNDRFQELSYNLKVLRSNLDDGDLEVAGDAIYQIAMEAIEELGEIAFVWHLAADACRLKALARQSKVSDTHVEAVITAAINRLDRQVVFAS